MDAINHIEITLQPQHVKPALESLLLSIFFHRTLDTIEPETREVLETHIACAPTPPMEKEVGDKVEEFARKYLGRDDGRYGGGVGVGVGVGSEKGEIALVFTQKKSRKGWFGITEEIVPWEAHFITIRISTFAPPLPASILTDALMRIMAFCAERRYSVPAPTPGETDRLSHQILISPPPPSDLFAPSPPLPARSPPPTSREYPSDTRQSRTRRSSSPGVVRDGRQYLRDKEGDRGEAGQGQGQGAMGYLEQAKDVLRATGARAGAVAGWTGKARGGG